MFVVRWKPHNQVERPWPMLVTCAADGSDITLAISDSDWSKGGHHPNWCPDGENVMMNLKVAGDGLRFVTAHHDGTGLRPMHPDIPGSGHPGYTGRKGKVFLGYNHPTGLYLFEHFILPDPF